MKILKNHYEGKPTIIINGRIINGCQDFTIDELKDVAKKHNATKEQVQQVRDAYAEDLANPDDPMDFIDSKCDAIRHYIAKYGEDRHRHQLINDPEYYVRGVIARYGNDHHRDLLINDPRYYVRGVIAEYGNDHHRDQLINDRNWGVRFLIAHYGNPHHREVLINDRNSSVREAANENT